MEIKSISNSAYFPKDVSGNTKKPQESVDNAKDKLVLSQEAQNLQKSQNSNKNLDEIKGKISNKFYDSSEVLSKVADKVLNDIKKK